jgi:single-strand DNA-binding protein
MSYTIFGKVLRVGDIETVGSNSFQKRELILEVQDGQYLQTPKLTATGDRVKILDGLTTSDEVTAHFNVRGREWQGKYFTDLEVWKVEKKEPAPVLAPEGEGLPF